MSAKKESPFARLDDSLKPREQLRAAVDPAKLKPEALLAILLKTGAPGCDVGELARRLLDAFQSVGELVRCDWRTLEERVRSYNESHPGREIRGLGEVKMLELSAAFELVRRGYETKAGPLKPRRIETDGDAAMQFRSSLQPGTEQEVFLVLPVDSARTPLCSPPLQVLLGTLDGVSVHPREVFKAAVRWGANAVFVAHNHPAGDPTPSVEDIALTRRLLETSRVLSIPILDHLVLGDVSANCGKGFVSIRAIRPDLFN